MTIEIELPGPNPHTQWQTSHTQWLTPVILGLLTNI